MPGVLNNREWATVIWCGVILVWMLTRRDVRGSVGRVFAAFLRPKLLFVVCGTAAWVLGLVVVARMVGIWTTALVGPTALWFLGAAIVVVMRSTRVSEESGFMSKTFKRAIGVAALIAALASLYVFPIFIEVILLPALAMLSAVLALAQLKSEYASLRKPLRIILASLGVGFLVYVVCHVVADVLGAHLLTSARLTTQPARTAARTSRAVLKGDWQSFALPIWLTIAVLPYVYIVGLVGAYESAFLQIDFCHSPDFRAQRRAKLALLLGVNIRARRLGEFRAPWPYRLVNQLNLDGARQVAREFSRTPLP